MGYCLCINVRKVGVTETTNASGGGNRSANSGQFNEIYFDFIVATIGIEFMGKRELFCGVERGRQGEVARFIYMLNVLSSIDDINGINV